MLRRLFISAAMLLAASGLFNTAHSGTDQRKPLKSKGKWTRVFTEEFDGAALNGGRWTTCYWWNENGCTNFSNKNLNWYMPANVQVSDGILRLVARPEKVTGGKGQVYEYTSGMVTTGRDYSELPRPPRAGFLYGHFEIRAKAPPGKGLWPALWLLPADRESRPEIDIMEVLGDTPNLLRMHFHYLDKKGKKASAGKTVKAIDLSKGWHVYGLRWEPGAIIWYLDGVEKWRYEDAKYISNEQMYLLMNLAVGGDFPGAPDANTKFPAEFLIDYVRVWQRAKQ